MSTEHQQYSTQNQSDAIQKYAEQRGIVIVRTYIDEARSGLHITGRNALQRLIGDVESGQDDYNTILVYDVSRWGRFQDTDESAYYEYICRRSGISVVYCAEQFENDGSPVSTLVKSIKRLMAAEYSRELSAKTFAGQVRGARSGYKQGGTAGYGIRRTLLDNQDTIKRQLSFGERKSIQTDRVVLTPGPDEEIETVRWMYRAFTEERMTERQIASTLNNNGITNDRNRPWDRRTVHGVLTNEKYVGTYVWNRSSTKLRTRRVRNSPDRWIRTENSFAPIIDKEVFQAAQSVVRSRTHNLSNDEMLDMLRVLLQKFGYLSQRLINETPGVPGYKAYAARFGSAREAYRRVGFLGDRDYSFIESRKDLRRTRLSIVTDIVARVSSIDGVVEEDPVTRFLRINNELAVAITVAPCRLTPTGSVCWKAQLNRNHVPDLTIIARMDESNTSIRDYYILPRIDCMNPCLQLAEHNSIVLEPYRFDNLELFYDLAARKYLSEEA
jgi:DNA invertase Pin-like site-specific DNA recombinase